MAHDDLESMPMGSITIETMTQRTSDRMVEQRGHKSRRSATNSSNSNSSGMSLSPKGKMTKTQLAFILAAITAAVIITIFIYFLASGAPAPLRPNNMQRSTELSNVHSHTNCSDFAGAIRAVQDLAGHASYLHQFEYERFHPCCSVRDYNNHMAAAAATNSNSNGGTNGDTSDTMQPRSMVDTSDIVFVVLTSSATVGKAKTVLNTWGQGLEHLLFISDEANAEIGSIGLSEEEMRGGSSRGGGGDGDGSTTGRTRGGNGNGGSGSSNAQQKYRQMWALKYIYADQAQDGLRSKPWFFLCDDDTWVNVPAILDLASRYHHACPVTIGYVWSTQSGNDNKPVDYVSASAGVLMSQAAFLGLTPAFRTEACPMTNSKEWNDVSFGRCAWEQKVQIVHHRGFYFGSPQRNNNPEPTLIWLPPIAESITYHKVTDDEMITMTRYANERWLYEAKPARNNTATYFESNAKFAVLAALQ